jgi:two-component system NarL family sensor kinase
VVNAAKHSCGDRLSVAAEAGDGALRIVVSDDGRGFDTSAPPAEGHFGLQLLRRRVESAGGSVQLVSRPGIGTTVTAALPLPS